MIHCSYLPVDNFFDSCKLVNSHLNYSNTYSNTNTMHLIRYFLICLLTLLWLPVAQAQEPHKITVQLQWKHQFEFAGFYAAIHKGFYAQRGLQVELREYQNGMDIIAEVLSGRAQYATYHSAIVQARLEGKPVKLLANYFKRLPLVIISSPQIRDMAGLRNKRLMSSPKDLDSPLFKLAFEQEGLQAGENIEVIPHTFNADPFINGEVDAMTAFITNEPFYLEQQGIDFNIIKLSDYMRSLGDLYLFTSDAVADQYPGQTRDFIEATSEGWRYALEHKEEIVDLILADYSQHKSREALLYEAEKTHDIVLPLPLPIGAVYEQLIAEVAKLIMRQEGFEDKGYLRNFVFNFESATKEIEFNVEERRYLDSTTFHRQLVYGWMPFNLKDKDGKIIGLSEDYWSLIRDKLALKEITGEPAVSFARLLKVMQQGGQIDIYPSTTRTTEREAYAVFSDSYVEFPIAIANLKGSGHVFTASALEGRVVAVGRTYSAYRMLKARYPDIKFLQVSDTREALERVVNREAYAAVDILPVLQYHIDYFASENVKLAGVTDVKFPVQVMVSKEHARLIPLINRAIASITPAEHAAIQQKWMMRDIITTPDYRLLWQVLGGAVLFFVIILFWNRKMAREIAHRRKIELQLIKAQQQAEIASQAKSQFLANMSHDIRTPMNGIIGMTQIALDTEPDLEQQKYLKSIKLSADSLLGLLSDILDFSKIEAGQLVMENRDFNLREMLDNIISMMIFVAEKKGIELHLQYDSSDLPVVVKGDKLRLRQIIVNLLSNAIKFTEKGSVTLQVIPENREEGRTEIHFIVIDTGIGIPVDKQEDIFSSFSQADTSTSREFGGTGLGLAICKQLLELMGGKIWLESETNKGATFHFTVVLKHGEKETILPQNDIVAPQVKGLNILLVDDNKINCEIGRHVLENGGYQVVEAQNGLVALGLLVSQHFDLILMDIQMPIMDGLTASTIIRDSENGNNLSQFNLPLTLPEKLVHQCKGKHIPIIAMTANAMKGDKEKCLAVGMDDYLTKPFVPEHVRSVVTKFLNPTPE